MIDLEKELREKITRVGADLFERRYAVGSSGNISARLPDGWLITPTDACLGHLNPLSIAKVSFTGEWISGDKPSKTLSLHRGIYEENSHVNGVVHTHSTHLVALTLSGVWSKEEILPPITPYQVMKVGRVPLIDYSRPGHDKAAAEVRQLARLVRAVMLERLGPVAWGQSVEHAAWIIEELEETAQLWSLSNPKPQPLSREALNELAETFGTRW
jgi:3-dehydro-4-phosphotetronate decarboxylase